MPPSNPAVASSTSASVRRYTALGATAVLLFSLFFSLALSRAKLFWEDELFELYTDSKPTLAAIISGQRHTPFSLEPPAFHLLLHTLLHLPLRPEVAMRLPSAAALLITQCCVFALTLRLTGRRQSALLAMVLPLGLATFPYSAEARVYAALTASYALAFLSYRAALSPVPRRRHLGVAGLFFSLGAAVLLHYYGLLLPLPFALAELFRTRVQRRCDWPVLTAILGSLLLFLANVPFLAGLRAVQAVYFDSGEAHPDIFPLTFIWLFFQEGMYRWRDQHPKNLLLCAAVLVLLGFGLWRLARSYLRPQFLTADSYLVLALSLGLFVPALNIVIGHCNSHSYSVRYGLPTVTPVIVLALVLLDPWLRRLTPWASLTLLPLVFLACSYTIDHRIRVAARDAQFTRASLLPTPDLQAAQSTVEDQHLYFQELPVFLVTFFYAPDELKHRLVLLQSVPIEWHWFHWAIASLFSMYMRRTTPLPVLPFEDFRRQPSPHLVVLYDTNSLWLRQELAAEHLTLQPRGEALHGHLYQLTFPDKHP